MLGAPLWLSLALFALSLSSGGLSVVTDDKDLGRAIVRSAGQHVQGPVALLVPGGRVAPGTLRLSVKREGSQRVVLVLSQGSGPRVTRVLRLPDNPERFDLAEVVAISLSEMRNQLEERALRSPPRPPVTAPPRVALAPPPPPAVAERVAPPTPQAPPPVLLPAPVLAPPRPAPFQPLRPPQGGPRVALGLGVALSALGVAVAGLGVASLVMDGRCVDQAVPCDQRYAGRVAGAVEVASGAVVILVGTGLLTSVVLRARRAPNLRDTPPAVVWSPLLLSGGAGAALRFSL